MAESTATVSSPAPGAVAPATVAPQAPQTQGEPAAPRPIESKRDARAQLRERFRSQDTQASEESPTEGSVFADEGEAGQVPAEGSESPEAASETPAEGSASDGGDGGEAEGLIEVEVPAGHPVLEGLGLKGGIKVQDEASARAVRALANGTYKRVAEVQELETENRQLKEQLVQRNSREKAQEKWKKSPDYQQAVDRYTRIKEEEGAEQASAYWKLIQRQFEDVVRQEYQAESSEMEAQEENKAAERWVGEAYERTTRIPQEIRQLPEFSDLFTATVQSLNAELEAGHHPEVRSAADAHKLFAQLLRLRLTGHPRVKQVLQQLDARDKAKSPAPESQPTTPLNAQPPVDPVEQFKRDAADRRRAAPPNPMGQLTRSAVTGEPVATEDGGEVDFANVTPYEARRLQRQKARDSVRARFRS